MYCFLNTVNVLKFRTHKKFRKPNIYAQNNFWKCPKISNSSSFAKRGFLKFRSQLSSSNFLSAHFNFGNRFLFFFCFFFLLPETGVVVLKATAKLKNTQHVITSFQFYVHKYGHATYEISVKNPAVCSSKCLFMFLPVSFAEPINP